MGEGSDVTCQIKKIPMSYVFVTNKIALSTVLIIRNIVSVQALTDNIHLEGTIFNIGPSFYFMESRKIIMKITKIFLFFDIKSN